MSSTAFLHEPRSPQVLLSSFPSKCQSGGAGVATLNAYIRSSLTDMDTRGRSGFKRMLLGSTASGVVAYAHCPVLIVK